ncbi:MAG: DUF748 domain-containing protein [Bacteroidetes bacterium]|nr:DUF748 domain-containing protein [Bacteroidota bacterium]
MVKSGKKRKIGIGWIILLSFIALVIIVRLLLPVIALHYINSKLDEHPDYDGNVGGLSMSLIAGSYSLNDIIIHDVHSGEDEPLLQVDKITIDIDYGTLFDGKILAEVVIDRPNVFLVQKPVEEPAPEDVEVDIQEAADDLIPVTLEKLRINEGIIRYWDLTSSPVFNVELRSLNVIAEGLSTEPRENKLLPATVRISAITSGEGRLDMTASFDPLAEVPTFDLNFELQNLQLIAYSHFIEDAASLDVVGGTFNLHTEIAAHDGFFTGYAKPIINDLEITPLDPKDTGLLQRIYESAATVIRDILEAPGEEQVALRVPVEGQFDDPDLGLWTAIITLLKNAFIEALVPSIDHSVHIGQVQEVIKEEVEGE